MAAPFLQPAPQDAPDPAWAARLIPGAVAGKKPPQRESGNMTFSFVRSCATVSGSAAAKLPVLRSPTVASRSTQNVLIIGSGKMARRIARDLENHPELGKCVRGVLRDRANGDQPSRGSDLDHLVHLARAEFIDEIILAAPQDRHLVSRVLRTARHLRVNVKFAPELFGCESAQKTEYVGGIPLISLHHEQPPTAGLRIKRALDNVIAGFALLALSTLLDVIALLVKFNSPGPVFDAALRAGRKGRPFRCYKFRTMVSIADELKQGLRQRNERQGPFFKITRDPRVTRVG
jgi:hypothetical protein